MELRGVEPLASSMRPRRSSQLSYSPEGMADDTKGSTRFAAVSDSSILSYRARQSILSTGAVLSVASAGTALSMFSTGSILSAFSAGSILSVASAGSILSIASAGSILSIRSSGTILCVDNRPVRELEGSDRAMALALAGSSITFGVAALTALRRLA